MISSSLKKASIPRMIVVIYEGFDMLDISGPFAFFAAAQMNPILVGLEKKNYQSGQGVEYVAQTSFDELHETLEGPYVIWIPGGFGKDFANQFRKGNPLFKAIKNLAKKSLLNCAVCVGAHIAAASKIIESCRVTTHWAFKDSLEEFDVNLVKKYPRYVLDSKKRVFTGGGVSSGLDEALAVIALVIDNDTAMMVQLINQYAPKPPFDAGTPSKAPRRILRATKKKVSAQVKALDTAIAKFLLPKGKR